MQFHVMQTLYMYLFFNAYLKKHPKISECKTFVFIIKQIVYLTNDCFYTIQMNQTNPATGVKCQVVKFPWRGLDLGSSRWKEGSRGSRLQTVLYPGTILQTDPQKQRVGTVNTQDHLYKYLDKVFSTHFIHTTNLDCMLVYLQYSGFLKILT